ncbi:MAG: DUF4124 domain-containing protein [Dokdonella sp.]
MSNPHFSNAALTPTLRAVAAVVVVCMLSTACRREPEQTLSSPPSSVSEPLVPAMATSASVDKPDSSPAPSLAIARESVAQLARDVEAAMGRTAACLAHTAAGSSSRSIAVHRWVDGAGITHYSDLPPGVSARDHRVIEVQGLPSIAVQAVGNDMNLPDELQQRAVADALGIQRVMRDVLGVGVPAGLTLHIVFVKSPETYAHLIGEPALASSAGAYSTAQQTIYVRMQAQQEAGFAVLRHEITHALVHESIGNLPTPVNEGMAEFFGRYRVGGLGGQVDVGADREAMIAAAPANDEVDALVDLLAREGSTFYGDDAGTSSRERRYLRAYALVALLMQSAGSRAVLAAVLAEQRADPCRPVASERILEQRYPGGLRALSGAWAGFMRNPPAGSQAY